MDIEVVFGEDPEWVLREAGAFLASDPVQHNLILTLLHARVAYPEPGRYRVTTDGSTVVGVAFQSPLDFVGRWRARVHGGRYGAGGGRRPHAGRLHATRETQPRLRRFVRRLPLQTLAGGRAPLHPLHRPWKPYANSVYRRIGYRVVAEGLRYRFE